MSFDTWKFLTFPIKMSIMTVGENQMTVGENVKESFLTFLMCG
jgi:hypothetical protein